MNTFRTRALLFCLIILSFANAQSNFPRAIEDNIDAFVTERLQRENLAGFQTVIVRDGQVIFNKAFGLADVENNIPMTVDTLMPAGTLNRAITVIAVMQLVEQGKINLDATLSEYLPWVKMTGDQQNTLTVRYLLEPEGMAAADGSEGDMDLDCDPDCPSMIGAKDTSKQAYIESLMPDIDVSGTGNQRNRSFLSAVLLGLIIEEKSGMSYEDYTQAKIFAPLQVNVIYDPEQAKEKGLAMGYTASSVESLVAKHYVSHNVLNPYMGLITSSKDIGKFLLALLGKDPKILKPETWESLMSATNDFHLFGTLIAGEYPSFGATDWVFISNLENRYQVFNVFYTANIAHFTMGNWQSFDVGRTFPVADMPLVAATNLLRYEDAPFATSPLAAESWPNPSVADIGRVTGSYTSVAGPLELFASGDELHGSYLGHEFKLEFIEGNKYLARSDYPPLNGIEMWLYGDRLEISEFWPLAVRVTD
jgi:CubicO group peptidase (beta-lactamase class C family)